MSSTTPWSGSCATLRVALGMKVQDAQNRAAALAAVPAAAGLDPVHHHDQDQGAPNPAAADQEHRGHQRKKATVRIREAPGDLAPPWGHVEIRHVEMRHVDIHPGRNQKENIAVEMELPRQEVLPGAGAGRTWTGAEKLTRAQEAESCLSYIHLRRSAGQCLLSR